MSDDTPASDATDDTVVEVAVVDLDGDGVADAVVSVEVEEIDVDGDGVARHRRGHRDRGGRCRR